MRAAVSGATMRAFTYSLAQPRPKGLHGSRWEFSRPNSLSLSRVQSLARFILGETVSAPPTPSIRPLAISIILELRKPSYRIFEMVSRSTDSWAAALSVNKNKKSTRQAVHRFNIQRLSFCASLRAEKCNGCTERGQTEALSRID